MSYELTYFDIRGLGETARLVFAAANVEYTDHRYPFNTDNFAHPEFDADKAAGKYDISLGSLPSLKYTGEDGSVTIGQSRAIERFLAKKFGLFGTNDIEAAQIDMIGEHIRDVKQKFHDARHGKTGDELAEAKAKFIAEQLPVWFGKIEKSLPGTSGFAVGNKLSLADVYIFSITKDWFEDTAASWAAASETPKIRASAEAGKAAVQHWIESRKVTKF